MLDDLTIREALRKYIIRKATAPLAVVEELRFHEGNCIADLVTVHSSLHGYEIKGETDKVARLKIQAPFYNKSLPSLTLVTTFKQLKWAEQNLEDFWGILLAYKKDEEVRFRYIRGATRNPSYDVRSALQVLWRDELIELAKKIGKPISNARTTRAQIADRVASAASRGTITLGIAELILRRATLLQHHKGYM